MPLPVGQVVKTLGSQPRITGSTPVRVITATANRSRRLFYFLEAILVTLAMTALSAGDQAAWRRVIRASQAPVLRRQPWGTRHRLLGQATSSAAFEAALQPPAHSYLLWQGRAAVGCVTLRVDQAENAATIETMALRPHVNTAANRAEVVAAAIAFAHQWYVSRLVVTPPAEWTDQVAAAGFTQESAGAAWVRPIV